MKGHIMGMTADELMKLADDREIREVELPNGRGSVYVRSLTGAEREAWEGSNFTHHRLRDGRTERVANPINVEARLVVRALVDEHGTRLFKDTDAGKIGNLPSAVVATLFNVIVEMNGISEDEALALEGNSEAADSGDSTSGSPSDWDAPSPSSSDGSLPES